MDFLDPRKRRAHSIRLTVAYSLMAIGVGLGSYLLLKAAEGYGVDPKTGDILQNGLLFVDSQPGGADIYLNDKYQRTQTSARLILPAGDYKLTLRKDGYRPWERRLTLNESSVARYVYPFLFPQDAKPLAIKTYSKTPPLITQSPDRRWLLVQQPLTSSNTITFDEYDTGDLTKAAKPLVIPRTLLSTLNDSSFREVEWSTDNKYLLLQHNFRGGSEFIIFNRDIPVESININRQFDITPSDVSLRNKRIDQLYIFLRESSELQIANTSNSTITPLLRGVLAFKASGPDLITYVTGENAAAGQVAARIWDGDQAHNLYSFKAGAIYLIDQAQFQGNWYYVVGSNTDERVNIYKNPLDSLNDASIARAVPLLSLNIKEATKASFSTNTRFIAAQAGQRLAVYDLEGQDLYRYEIKEPLSGVLRWMDGHRMIGTTNGQVFITDYDSTNPVFLTPSAYLPGGFFNPRFEQFYTIVNTAGGAALHRVDMRAGADLPR